MELIDAQQIAAEHPLTFEVPDDADLDAIAAGSSVKVCNGSDRFWVLVTSVDGDRIHGTIQNDIEPEGNVGEPISLERRHVYDVDD